MHHRDRQLRISRDEDQLSHIETIRAVTRGLAHEIKNPLGGLRGAAQLLEGELPDEALREYTGIIISEADRLQALVNKILGPNTFAQKQYINIHQVTERVRQLIEAEYPKLTGIICDYDPSIPEIHADPDQLIQALLNIVRNAAQALSEQALSGHTDGNITLKTRTQRQVTFGSHRYKLVVRIEVIDNGPGIPEEMIKRIFYPMVTGRAEGTGLGLSIAQSLISQHGGLIECSSSTANTTFTILLPIEEFNG